MNETKGKLYALRAFVGSTLGRWTLTAVLAVMLFSLAAFLTTTDAVWVLFALIFVLAFFGWKTLNKIQPNIFLFMPVIGWVIFFVVKFFLSYIIGIVAAPIYIGKAISTAVQSTLVKIIDDTNNKIA